MEPSMKQNLTTLQSCHKLLQHILQDAFNIQSLLFTPPYSDFRKIDMGLRSAVWSDYVIQDANTFFADSFPETRLIIVKSNLGFFNLLATFPNEKKTPPDFITVGPFRNNELSANYFTQILKDAQISPAEIQRIKYMYERMPFAQLDSVVNVMKHILETFFPDFADIVPEYLQFSDQKRIAQINDELLETYSAEYAENYRKILFDLLQYITQGDSSKAKDTLQLFLQETMLLNHKNMREYKMILQLLCDYCHFSLFHTSIHPLHILKQTASLKRKIEEETSLARLEQFPNEICRKFCLLVKNYANAECSRLTKDVMTYIQFHLEEELSLRTLAASFHKNPSALSNSFSKETGLSITAYIQQTRVQAALRLLNTTDMSIAEVATAVGYQDFSYFSKVFSRHVGCSPRAYKAGTDTG